MTLCGRPLPASLSWLARGALTNRNHDPLAGPRQNRTTWPFRVQSRHHLDDRQIPTNETQRQVTDFEPPFETPLRTIARAMSLFLTTRAAAECEYF